MPTSASTSRRPSSWFDVDDEPGEPSRWVTLRVHVVNDTGGTADTTKVGTPQFVVDYPTP